MSNDTAIRIIHFYFNRLGKKSKKKIIARTDGYHGSTYLAMSMTGVAFDHQGFDLAPGLVRHIPNPNPYRRPEGMSMEAFCDEKVADLENAILDLGPENVAAFIAEPIMGAGGVIVPPPGYHRRTKEVCEKYEVLYISDEVVTGFGRLGHFFASETVFDFVPDIITCAKGLSSGYLPLSGTLLSDDIYDVISVPQTEGALFTHGFTYSGHPVCCAAGLKNIEIMERDDICAHVLEVGPYLEEQLDTLRDSADRRRRARKVLHDVRGERRRSGDESAASGRGGGGQPYRGPRPETRRNRAPHRPSERAFPSAHNDQAAGGRAGRRAAREHRGDNGRVASGRALVGLIGRSRPPHSALGTASPKERPLPAEWEVAGGFPRADRPPSDASGSARAGPRGRMSATSIRQVFDEAYYERFYRSARTRAEAPPGFPAARRLHHELPRSHRASRTECPRYRLRPWTHSGRGADRLSDGALHRSRGQRLSLPGTRMDSGFGARLSSGKSPSIS